MRVMGHTVSRMSEQTNEHIPALTLGWRLKMALGHMAAHDMADALEVHRATVARWMADRGTPPRSVFVKQWALIAAVTRSRRGCCGPARTYVLCRR